MDTTTDSTPEDTTNNNEASESKDVQMEQADVTTEEKEQEPEMVDPTEALSKEDLTTLTESKGDWIKSSLPFKTFSTLDRY